MKDIKKIEIENQPIYLKKDPFGRGGYRVVYPYRNEDGSINYFNLLTGGSWWNIFVVSFIVFALIGSIWAYRRDIGVCTDLMNKVVEDPCKWCRIMTESPFTKQTIEKINWTEVLERLEKEEKNETQPQIDS